MREFDFEGGEVLLINKPLRWTSFDVVGKIRNSLKQRKLKVGHAGTLDPLATGLLIVCTGRATRQIDSYQGLDKTYKGTFMLGASRPSYDLETEVDAHYETGHITQHLLDSSLAHFTGRISQVSPAYSALKIKGERAYEIARRGEAPEIKAREVYIHSFSIDIRQFPSIAFEIVCSKGTYIRSLVHDLGKFLDSGAYLSSLERTAIGTHLLADAWEIDALAGALRQARGEAKNESAGEGSTRPHVIRTRKGFHEPEPVLDANDSQKNESVSGE